MDSLGLQAVSNYRWTRGPSTEAKQLHHADLPAQQPGVHLWVVLSMYRVNPRKERFDLDMENLLTIEGPCCYWCEMAFSEAEAKRRCRGDAT